MQAASQTPSHPRFAYIDTLRGLAAVYVLFFHVLAIPQPLLLVSPALFPLIQKGYSGVTLFFILSAFTMMNSMRGRETEPARDRNFYVRRVFRIVPLYYFWLAVMLLRVFILRGHLPPLLILSSLTFTFNFIPRWEEGIVWASWTLGVEMVFYAVFPLIFRYITNWKRSVLFLLGTILVALLFEGIANRLGAPSNFVRYSFFSKLPAFAFGVLTYFIYEELIENRRVRWGWSLALTAAALGGFGLFMFVNRDRLVPNVSMDLATCVCFVCLVLGLAIRPWKLFVNRFTIFLGTISYSLYLCHPVLIQYIMPYYKTIYTLPLRPSLNYLLCALLTLLVVVAAAYLTYRIIEKPGMDLGRQIIRRLRAARPAPPVLAPGSTE